MSSKLGAIITPTHTNKKCKAVLSILKVAHPMEESYSTVLHPLNLAAMN